jgi:thiol-disulfide isomerase/thioredoxin
MSSHQKAERAKKRKRGMGWGEKIVIAIIVLVVIWAAYSFSQPAPSSTTTKTSGAPDFTLPIVGPNGLTGQKVSLSSFQGKVVLLEFMVPWCSHCQDMAPVLEQLYQQYGPQNVAFISVSGSWSGATANDAAQFIKNYQSSWVYVYDSSNGVFNTYGVDSTPTFFIISKSGQIVSKYNGEVAYDTLATDLTRYNS